MKKLLSLVLTLSMLLANAAIVLAEQNVVNVSNVDELISAIASDTKIVLAPGEYNVKSELVQDEWGSYLIGKSIVIENINNLEIVGTTLTKVALDVGYMPVFDVINSSNITFSNLSIGHNVPEYGCEGEGDCIILSNSSNITVNNCDLYGCGVLAIFSYESSNIVINNSTIRDCMIKAFDFYELTGNVEINNSTFYGNAYSPFHAQNDSFISASSKEGFNCKVDFNNCTIYDNKNMKFFTPDGSIPAEVNLKDCNVYNNAWENAVTVMVSPLFNEIYDMVIFEDQLPLIVNDRTLVPARAVFEAMGYNVEWDQDTLTATITSKDGNSTVKVTINSTTLDANGEGIEIDVPAQVINDRTYLPLRAISEAFLLPVEWNGETRTVYIG